MVLRALGTIIDFPKDGLSKHELYTGLLDYYDDWNSQDPDLAAYQPDLCRHANSLGHDLVNMATYAHIVLEALDRLPDDSGTVVIASAMAEAFLFSLRCAYDSVGAMTAYCVSDNRGQVPNESLGDLIDWSKKYPGRVRPLSAGFLARQFDDFFWFRGLRDKISHQGVGPNVHTDGRQFNLWLYSDEKGWITREPLLPLLKRGLLDLLRLSDEAAILLNTELGLPQRRIRSRVVSGIYLPALHRLIESADEYASHSP